MKGNRLKADEGERRTVNFHMRFTLHELTAIKNMADELRLPLADYLRYTAHVDIGRRRSTNADKPR